ncbi:syntaxin-binding protein 6 isoform X2 [Hippocampus comes]|nr:PREDICTED: syntaxin-binding protein 6 isoform X2 [Hippocampus comes]XP_019728152.1 PREDICTED: syntaxin-binding protein 6 isoform X2 [Hippocampus comes]XP_019728153.1 PREDICTED: syntaxin-binding protein 6 isoform X2 [Hippocampus comes]
MSAKATINKEVFVPHDEKMLAAVQVKRKTKKKIPFLATGGQGDYMTFICLSVTNKKPAHVSITKVKQFQGSSAFVKRSQWTIDQLRQVNGIDSNKDSPEFDLTFDNAFDQWVAGSAGEKCTFVQILHHTCQRYIPMRKPEFVNCQSKLLGEGQTVDSVVVRCKVFMNRVRKDLVAHHSLLRRRGKTFGRTYFPHYCIIKGVACPNSHRNKLTPPCSYLEKTIGSDLESSPFIDILSLTRSFKS